MRLETGDKSFIVVNEAIMRAESSLFRNLPITEEDNQCVVVDQCSHDTLVTIVNFLRDGTLSEVITTTQMAALLTACVDLDIVRMLERLMERVGEQLDASSPAELRAAWGLSEDGGFTPLEAEAMRHDDVWQRR